MELLDRLFHRLDATTIAQPTAYKRLSHHRENIHQPRYKLHYRNVHERYIV